MKLKLNNSNYFIHGINLFLTALIVGVTVVNFSFITVLFCSIALFSFNLFYFIRSIAKRFHEESNVYEKELKKETNDPAKILSDIDLELERRRAAERFERN